MRLKIFCKNIAYDAVLRSNHRNPLVGETCDDGTVYIGRSLDPDLPPSVGRNNLRETWNLVSDYGLYVMPHDLSQKDQDKFVESSYVDGVGEAVYRDLEAYGHKDWRRPTLSELCTLYDLSITGVLRGTFNMKREDINSYETTYLSSSAPTHNSWKYGLDFASERCIAQEKITDDHMDEVNIRLIRTGPVLE